MRSSLFAVFKSIFACVREVLGANYGMVSCEAGCVAEFPVSLDEFVRLRWGGCVKMTVIATREKFDFWKGR